MIDGSPIKARAEVHAWTAVAYAGFYCGFVIAKDMRAEQMAAAWVLALLGVALTIWSLKRIMGMDIASSIEAYVRQVMTVRRGPRSAMATVVTVGLVLICAAWLAPQRNPDVVGVIEGLRNGAFLATVLYMLRLAKLWIVTVFLAWAIGDILVLWLMGSKVGEQTGSITLVSTMAAGWLALMAQDVLEEAFGGRDPA